MPSKQVTDRQKSALAVTSAARTHTADVTVALTALLSPHLKKGEALPNTALLIELAARSLDTAQLTMTSADQTHLHELADDDAPRDARDAAAKKLSEELIDLREWLTGLYGGSAIRSLGFSGPTPEDPVALERFAGEVVHAITNKPLPKPRRQGVKWDAAETLADIEALRLELGGHLKDVAREAREAQATLRTKNETIAIYDDRFSRVASFLVGLFRLAGEAALANRVRPSSRRPGQTEVEAGGGSEDGGEEKPAQP